MAIEASADRALSGPQLPEREAAVLAELAREGDAHVAFQGLRRRLDVHQQALTRTLRRLEDDGLIARDDRGYKLTERGFAALEGKGVAPDRREVLTVVQAMLPPHVDGDAVAGHLSRRWFQGLRWYGQADAPGEITLTWLADPGNAKVRVRVAGAAVSLEIEVPPGGPARGFAATRGVLAALAELYGLGAPEHERAGAYSAADGFAA